MTGKRPKLCVLCKEDEYIDHLFVDCPFSKKYGKKVLKLFDDKVKRKGSSLLLIERWNRQHKDASMLEQVAQGCFSKRAYNSAPHINMGNLFGQKRKYVSKQRIIPIQINHQIRYAYTQIWHPTKVKKQKKIEGFRKRNV